VRILAIETSSEPSSVAVAHADGVAQRRASGGHVAERALSMIADLLQEQSIDLDQIDAFAFGSGPGAFTGLRVACGLAQGLAFALRRPVIPVGSLRAMAFGAWRHVQRPARAMVAIDARMGQLYWAVFEGEPPARELAGPALATPDRIEELVARWQPEVIAGDALRVFESRWPAHGAPIRLPELRCDASMVAELARADLAGGRAVAARDAAPDYVRDRVALTVAERNATAASCEERRTGDSR
jgi:tRNA threonylcarbamoyladenosine biosynthesis protein TsaB